METHERDLEGESLRRQFEAADQALDRAAQRVVDTGDDPAVHKLALKAHELAGRERDAALHRLNMHELSARQGGGDRSGAPTPPAEPLDRPPGSTRHRGGNVENAPDGETKAAFDDWRIR